MQVVAEETLDSRFEAADEAGIRLEVLDGQPFWQFHPSMQHQWTLRQIQMSLQRSRESQRDCACVDVSDVYIRFPDGSLLRPDISIFCELPPIQQEASRVIPKAVVEILSPGSAVKDLKAGPPFYLANGVLDVIVVDPVSKQVVHFDAEGRREHTQPVTLRLKCGCELTA